MKKSLSRSILITLLVFTLLAVLATAISLVTMSYFNEEGRFEDMLVNKARSSAQILEEYSLDERIELLKDQFPGEERFTLINSEGVVVFDTAVSGTQLSNHAARPEVLGAEDAGESVLVRRSQTLNRDTLYVAERLADGSVIRVSQERFSLIAFLGSMALPVGGLLLCAILLVVALSRFLTNRIMRPLAKVDLNNPLPVDAYEEMRPLLQRVSDQQQQLVRQNEELKRADGLRREFSANVSHEMKTPLQVISGSAEMIANGLVAPGDIQEFGERIYSESGRLRALINDVLTLSRLDEASIDNAEKMPVSLLDIVSIKCEQLRPLAEGRGVNVAFEGDDVIVFGSEALLEQAVSNLVENAIRYSNEGGHVNVVLQREEVAGNAQAVVRVSDEGIGIPSEDLDKIFERFYRADKSRSKETGGTGLGLAIVKHAALYHGGDVSVESTLGEGSTFTLRLPLKNPEAD